MNPYVITIYSNICLLCRLFIITVRGTVAKVMGIRKANISKGMTLYDFGGTMKKAAKPKLPLTSKTI